MLGCAPRRRHAWTSRPGSPSSPQFLDPSRASAAQGAILVATFVTLAAANAAADALLAARLSGAVRRLGLRRALNRAGGRCWSARG
jgi:threonine/homoserine/homoserine lactone efflux protein